MAQTKEEKFTVFADDEWYKKDHSKMEDWSGLLQKADPVKLPPHSGHGPVQTTFYQLGVYRGPQIPLQERILYSHGEHSHILDKYIGKTVKISGKLHDDQIWAGYMTPISIPLSGPPGTFPGSGSGGGVPAGGSANNQGHRITVFANDEWYKKDHDKVEEFVGRLQKYDQFHIPPGQGHGPVVTLFYKLTMLSAPYGDKVIYTNKSQSKILEQHLDQEVRIIGKLHDTEIWPGYLIVLTNPGGPNVPAGGASGGANTIAPIILVFADTEWYKKDHDKVEEWSGKLEKYDQFNIGPHGGIGPEVTLFYKLSVTAAPHHVPQDKIVYSDNSKNQVLTSHIGKEVTLVGKLHNEEIWPGYLIPRLA